MPLFFLRSFLEASFSTMNVLSSYERDMNQAAVGQRLGEKKLCRATTNT
jgi:hypothetical protein